MMKYFPLWKTRNGDKEFQQVTLQYLRKQYACAKMEEIFVGQGNTKEYQSHFQKKSPENDGAAD